MLQLCIFILIVNNFPCDQREGVVLDGMSQLHFKISYFLSPVCEIYILAFAMYKLYMLSHQLVQSLVQNIFPAFFPSDMAAYPWPNVGIFRIQILKQFLTCLRDLSGIISPSNSYVQWGRTLRWCNMFQSMVVCQWLSALCISSWMVWPWWAHSRGQPVHVGHSPGVYSFKQC